LNRIEQNRTDVKLKGVFRFSIAFTLAEVLITLGIIGIVAEMTIPTLTTNYQKQVAVTQLKQTYSDLANAVKLSEADNGESASWNFDSGDDIAASHTFYDTYFKPYLMNAKFCNDGTGDGSCGMTVSGTGVNYMLNNGVGLSMVLKSSGVKMVYILIDVNNAKKPNVMGKDVFYFTLSPTTGLIPYDYVKGMTRDQAISDPTFGCVKSGVTYPRYLCTALLMIDSWQMRSDYPWD